MSPQEKQPKYISADTKLKSEQSPQPLMQMRIKTQEEREKYVLFCFFIIIIFNPLLLLRLVLGAMGCMDRLLVTVTRGLQESPARAEV